MDPVYAPTQIGTSATAFTSYNDLTREYYIQFENLDTTAYFADP